MNSIILSEEEVCKIQCFINKVSTLPIVKSVYMLSICNETKIDIGVFYGFDDSGYDNESLKELEEITKSFNDDNNSRFIFLCNDITYYNPDKTDIFNVNLGIIIQSGTILFDRNAYMARMKGNNLPRFRTNNIIIDDPENSIQKKLT